jgi:hypothetical protein
MASPFQQRALRRKLIYAALILVLGTAAWGWRYADFTAFGMHVKGVDAQAHELSIREQSRGEVDLVGAVVRLTTMGSRGLATCVMWMDAMDAQKKNQWNELELRVRSLTKLQPHFITPWIFQSWNLAYNVSVESDRPNDKYFYIARGIGLLAEGERQNRDNPDMRWSIGFFLQHKIGQSDETNVLRSLSQLSMIPPNERDPGRFGKVTEGRQEVDYKELEDFCKKHPQLVRRLREGIHRERKTDVLRQFRCERPEELVQFLSDNYRVPSLWKDRLPSAAGMWKDDPDQKLSLTDRFPVLPPPHTPRPPQQLFDNTTLTSDSPLRDEDDAYQVSRAWYSYAQEALPPADELPGSSKPIVDRVRQRIPRHMTTLIFRDYPAQAQRYTAERLQDEGWFDETGWAIPDWFRDQNDRFTAGEPAVVGGGRKWGQEAWQKTFELWRNFGEANHVLFSVPSEEEAMEQRARAFADKHNVNDASPVPQLREETLDAETRREFFAWQFMKAYSYYRHVSNFPHHYNRSLVEAKEETVQARKAFFEAESLRLRNRPARALKRYQDPDALQAWRNKVLLTNKEFRRDSFIQEQTFELQLKYVNLYTELGGNAFKAQVTGMVLVPLQNPPGAGVCPVGCAFWVPGLMKDGWGNPLLGGPFDGVDSEGQPLLDDYARMAVLRRLFPASFSGPEQQKMPPSGQPGPPK